jgi:hypothetical protein
VQYERKFRRSSLHLTGLRLDLAISGGLGVQRPIANRMTNQGFHRPFGVLFPNSDKRNPVPEADVPDVRVGQLGLLTKESLDVFDPKPVATTNVQEDIREGRIVDLHAFSRLRDRFLVATR